MLSSHGGYWRVERLEEVRLLFVIVLFYLNVYLVQAASFKPLLLRPLVFGGSLDHTGHQAWHDERGNWILHKRFTNALAYFLTSQFLHLNSLLTISSACNLSHDSQAGNRTASAVVLNSTPFSSLGLVNI